MLAGCAAQRLEREGLELIDAGRIEEGIVKLEQAVKEKPNDAKYRLSLLQARDRLTGALLGGADRALASGNIRDADSLYRRVLAIEPQNTRALDGLRAIEKEQSIAEFIKAGENALRMGDVEAAARNATAALALNPRHPGAAALRAQIDEVKSRDFASYPQVKSKLSRPVSLEFREANLKMVFDVLARTSGINFIFDKDVRPDIKVTIFVKQVAVEDAIDLLLIQSQLEKKVVNENSLLIFPATPQKLRDYQDLVVRSFYLANADAKQTLNLIKTILKTKDVFIDEKLNLLVMRDTPDAIRIAERLIGNQDAAEPEVMLDVEIMELTNTDDSNLGFAFQDNIPLTVQIRDNWRIFSTNPSIPGTLNLRDITRGGRILANPRIRVKNKEKAKVQVGDRVPVINSTVTPTQTTQPGQVTNTIISQSVQYLDVGLKLEIEPTIRASDEIAIKVNLEVTTQGEATRDTQGNPIAFRVGTRNATTVLQLKDGETQILAGLIRNDEIQDTQRVPLLGDIPVLGRLFSNEGKTKTRTEIALSITPRIVRNLKPLGPQVAELVSGTESALRAKPLTARSMSEKDAIALRGTGTPPAAGALPPQPAVPIPLPAPAPPTGPVGPAPSAAPPSPAAAAPGPPTASGPVVLNWLGSEDAKVGQEFLVALQTTSEQPLVSAALQVGYDPAALKVIDVTEGDLLKRDGGQTTFTHKVDAQTGKVFVGLSRAGATGVTGDGTLLTIRFAAQAAKADAPVQVVVFSGVGQGNKLLQANLPAPLEVSVAP